MIYSAFNDIAEACRVKSADEVKVFLNSHGIYFFDEIYSALETVNEEPKRKFPGESPVSIIKFIVYAYSEDSPYLILRANAKAEKEGICDHLGISEIWRHMLVELDCNVIRKAVTSYLEYFAGIEFKQWQFMKIQYNDLMTMIVNKAFHIYEKDKTEPSFDQKSYFEAEGKTERLATRIAKLEGELREKKGTTMKLILELQSELKNSKGKAGQRKSLSVENVITH